MTAAAFFDLDKTVIAKASMVAFGRPLLREGMISRRLLARGLWSHLLYHHFGADEAKMLKVREQALRITRGWEQARISAIVSETLIDVIEPIVFDEALDLINAHKAAGEPVFIISASPHEIVAPLAQYLGADGSIASRARLDSDGRYTGEVEFYSYGPYKVEAMREIAERDGIDLAASYAYSDSITDLPMLEAVGHATVVNPDRELARIAAERGWEIRRFAHPVPLRARATLPRPRTAALFAGIAIGTALGAGTIWWLTRPAVRQSRVSEAQRNASRAVTRGRSEVRRAGARAVGAGRAAQDGLRNRG